MRAEPVDAQPVAWRWKHIKDDRWFYGKLPKHLQPRPGVKLPYHLIEPLYAAPQPQAPSSDDVRDKRIAEWKSSYDAKCVENTANFLRAEKAEAALAAWKGQK